MTGNGHGYPQTQYTLKVNLDKAALNGVSAADVTRTMQIALSGSSAGLLHRPEAREDGSWMYQSTFNHARGALEISIAPEYIHTERFDIV